MGKLKRAHLLSIAVACVLINAAIQYYIMTAGTHHAVISDILIAVAFLDTIICVFMLVRFYKKPENVEK